MNIVDNKSEITVGLFCFVLFFNKKWRNKPYISLRGFLLVQNPYQKHILAENLHTLRKAIPILCSDLR